MGQSPAKKRGRKKKQVAPVEETTKRKSLSETSVRAQEENEEEEEVKVALSEHQSSVGLVDDEEITEINKMIQTIEEEEESVVGQLQ